MISEEVFDLVSKIQKEQCESNYIEVKAAKNGCPKLYDTFSSFSNQNGGGILVLGLDEEHKFSVCGVYDAQDMQKKIAEMSLQMEPVIHPVCTTALVEGKTVVVVEVPEIEQFRKPCFYKGTGRLKGSFVRVGDSDRRMTEYEVYSLEAFKQNIQDELRIVEKSKPEDLQTIEFERFLVELKSKKQQLSNLNVNRIRELQGFVCDGTPTVAGLLLFADYPQEYFPQLSILAVRVPGEDMSSVGMVGERFLDNTRIEGNISSMLDDAIAFVRKNSKTSTVIHPMTGKREDKTEYPMIAIREVILNALVHRDYSSYTQNSPITIRMFSNRIEVENPGGLYGRMTLDQLGKMSADTRNPRIANALEILNKTENRYSGIPTIRSAMEEYGLPEPVFENNNGCFKVTLYNSVSANVHTDASEDISQRVLEFCVRPRSRSELETCFKGELTIAYLMQKYITPFVESGLLNYTIPDKPKSKFQKYVTSVKGKNGSGFSDYK